MMSLAISPDSRSRTLVRYEGCHRLSRSATACMCIKCYGLAAIHRREKDTSPPRGISVSPILLFPRVTLVIWFLISLPVLSAMYY